jgi:glycosyltransferase involved in cell wall biosynthesis
MSKPITILYVWKSGYPWDVRVEKICKSLVNSGYKVVLLARWNGEEKQKEEHEGVIIVRAGFEKKRIFSTPISSNPLWKKYIQDAILEYKPSLIIPREIMLGSLGGRLAKKYKISVIMDMAENYPAAMKDWEKYNKYLLSKFIINNLNLPERVEAKSVELMNGIITVCKENSERLIKKYKFNQDDIIEVHNTPAKNIYNFKTKGTKFLHESLTFGHHGYLTGEKRIDVFLEGFLQFNKEYPKSKFIIAGDGPSLNQLKEIAEKSDSNKSVVFLGSYSHSDFQAIIEKFDIGVLPYQLNDFNNNTLHNKIFDYFAFGLPVITSETIPFKRIISETQAGICSNCTTVENVYSGLKDFIDNDLETMAENSFKAFEDKYNWENDEKNLLKFIERFVSGNL